MPYQVVPSLLIIFGAFNAVAGGMWAVHRVAYGKDREICRDEFSWSLERRDLAIADYQKQLAKAAKQA
eukprot:CAMPEP_0118705848 /NCGR_PEP_ID=MMETSP0800-20121206/20145_1 /TAXON_ID=210618 ORGANISM="Striatella unipunctata, Strain CCMP2910" /NCGR_SAMPLE_ID=MMETSP0800 /ASSEMBLY_ACC=CAM_ASM_000638 /LENGTH=67 /DNA_ID=CAMNT_0006608147 /DNA_START=202 /DNA_END=405 /DNA_ORIENTATION=+